MSPACEPRLRALHSTLPRHAPLPPPPPRALALPQVTQLIEREQSESEPSGTTVPLLGPISGIEMSPFSAKPLQRYDRDAALRVTKRAAAAGSVFADSYRPALESCLSQLQAQLEGQHGAAGEQVMVQDDTFLLSVIHRGASEEEARMPRAALPPPFYPLAAPLLPPYPVTPPRLPLSNASLPPHYPLTHYPLTHYPHPLPSLPPQVRIMRGIVAETLVDLPMLRSVERRMVLEVRHICL